MKVRSIALTVAVAAGLAACSHNVVMVGRETGAMGIGSAAASMGNSGTLTIDLLGETYSGPWVYMSHGGSVGYGLINTYGYGANSGSVHGSATTFNQSTGGRGTVLMSAPSGSTLRCEFDYNTWTSTGLGVCEHSDGEIFDLQIS